MANLLERQNLPRSQWKRRKPKDGLLNEEAHETVRFFTRFLWRICLSDEAYLEVSGNVANRKNGLLNEEAHETVRFFTRFLWRICLSDEAYL
jgi:hypothetical protein